MNAKSLNKKFLGALVLDVNSPKKIRGYMFLGAHEIDGDKDALNVKWLHPNGEVITTTHGVSDVYGWIKNGEFYP